MRFLTYAGLDPGRLRAAFDEVRSAIDRNDLRSADVKKLLAASYFRAKRDGYGSCLNPDAPRSFLVDAAHPLWRSRRYCSHPSANVGSCTESLFMGVMYESTIQSSGHVYRRELCPPDPGRSLRPDHG